MISPSTFYKLPKSLWVAAFLSASLIAAVIIDPRDRYPDLHLLLDTLAAVLSGLLALLLWNVGTRSGKAIARLLAVAFVITFTLEAMHALVGVQWSGPFGFINSIAPHLGPATWPPAAFVLPIGIAIALYGLKSKVGNWAPSALSILAVALVIGFYNLPSYNEPSFLRKSRFNLVLIPFLWLAVAGYAFQLRTLERKISAVALMALVFGVTSAFILFSRNPDDSMGMVAHLGKVCSYFILLLSLIQMASMDIIHREMAERELAELNTDLEQRIQDRSAKLESANLVLQAEIAERREIEASLVESDIRFKSMADSVPVHLWMADPEKHRIWFNQQWLDFVDRTFEEESGEGWITNIHPEDIDQCLKTYRDAFDQRKHFETEYRLRYRDGTWRWVLSRGVPRYGPDGKFAGYVGSRTDITGRKEAEQEIYQSQKLLRAVVDNSAAVIYLKDLEGRYLLINRGYERSFGFEEGSVVGKSDFDLFPPENAAAYRAVDDEVITTGQTLEREETAVLRDGLHTYLSIKCPILDSEGEAYALCGISSDITDRKRSEVKLQVQFGRLQLLHQITRAIGDRLDLPSIFNVVMAQVEDQLPVDFVCIALCDMAEEVVTITGVGPRSGSLAAECGLSAGAQLKIDGSGLASCLRGQLVYDPDLTSIDFHLARCLAGVGLRSLVCAPLLVESNVFGVLIAGRNEPESFTSGSCEFLQQLSEHVALASHQAQLYNALQQAYDDLRRSQQLVMQQERLRALGQMASGIAHDINNAISPIAIYTETILETESGISERARGYLVVMQRAIEDVAATVARMREFYRAREPQLDFKLVDLTSLVGQVLSLTRARWSDMAQLRGIQIVLKEDLDQDAPRVLGDETEIREALTNLIFNALDSMPEGGVLTLRTGVKASGHPIVYVEVEDTGKGMDEETRLRCLEPFFTTKGERGTGLGLAMVYGMAQRHGIDLDIESEVGKGTTIRLNFTAQVEDRSAGDVPVSSTYLRGLKILVVDDDPLLLKSLRDALEIDDHVVSTAPNGKEGIRLFEEAFGQAHAFDVVITDLGMPYVDGRQVATAVKGASLETPVILLTGWGQRMIVDGERPDHVDLVLAKPPKLRDLRDALFTLCRAALPASKEIN